MSVLKIALSAALIAAAPALAQSQSPPQAPAPPAAPEAAAPAEPNADEMAATLNKQQRVKQTYTLTREIDGKVVETTRRTIEFTPGDASLPSEAGDSALEQLKEEFANEVLTRTEAWEEAKLDFTVADASRRGKINEDEFVALIEGWRAGATAADADPADRRRLTAFTRGSDPAVVEAAARAKFRLMAGADGWLSRRQYIRETMIDFDAADGGKDRYLRGEELIRYRAATSGAALPSPAAENAVKAVPPLLKRQ